MRRKLLAVLMSLTMVCALAACGSKEPAEETGTEEVATETDNYAEALEEEVLKSPVEEIVEHVGEEVKDAVTKEYVTSFDEISDEKWNEFIEESYLDLDKYYDDFTAVPKVSYLLGSEDHPETSIYIIFETTLADGSEFYSVMGSYIKYNEDGEIKAWPGKSAYKPESLDVALDGIKELGIAKLLLDEKTFE